MPELHGYQATLDVEFNFGGSVPHSLVVRNTAARLLEDFANLQSFIEADVYERVAEEKKMKEEYKFEEVDD